MPASGNTIRLQLQETSTNIFQVTLWQNSAAIYTTSNVSLTLPNELAIGVSGQTVYASDASPPPTFPTWQSLLIQCQNVASSLELPNFS